MDALFLVLQLFFRSFVILLPIVIGGLAFRRLTKSKSSNAWIYAVTCLFTAVVFAGLLPWAVGLSATNGIFFVLAAFCPAVWFAITTICDVSRKGHYEPEIEDFSLARFKASRKAVLATLVLNDPVTEESNPVDDVPVPTFIHRKPADTDAPSVPPLPVHSPAATPAQAAPPAAAVEEIPQPISEKSVLDIARKMRRNKSSEERRPKLLPAPTVTRTV